MKCERFQVNAGKLARNDIMEANERARALAHAAACEGCAEALALQNRLSDGFRSLAQETRAAQAPPTVEDKLLAAFRERTRVASFPAATTRRHLRISAAAAAVFLLAVGILGWRWYAASVPHPTAPADSREAGNVAPVKPEISPVVAVSPTQTPNVSTPLVSRRLPRRHLTTSAKLNPAKQVTAEMSVSAAIHETREITTAFVPLGFGSALDLQDGGQMVRVELPRSALARFGLPMNMNRADERIKADVLVGADGLARAIRFVQPIDESTAGLRPRNERNEQ